MAAAALRVQRDKLLKELWNTQFALRLAAAAKGGHDLLYGIALAGYGSQQFRIRGCVQHVAAPYFQRCRHKIPQQLLIAQLAGKHVSDLLMQPAVFHFDLVALFHWYIPRFGKKVSSVVSIIRLLYLFAICFAFANLFLRCLQIRAARFMNLV